MTSDRDRLLARLNETPFLLIDCATHDAQLVGAKEVTLALSERTYFAMNLLRGFDQFAALTAGQDEFSQNDIATIAGFEYPAAYAWKKQKVLVPSIRKAQGTGYGKGAIYSYCDAFAAGVIGTLRRQNIGLEVMRKISPLLNEAANQADGVAT